MNRDVIIIGSGVCGSEIARLLTLQGQSVTVLEKGDDVGMGATRANSGIIHAGFDCVPGTLKAKLNVEGAKLYPSLQKRLKFNYSNVGALVVAKKGRREDIQKLLNQGLENGVEGLEIIEREEILKIVPTLADDIECALLAKTSAIAGPYQIAIAMAEEAVLNGCDFQFEKEVVKIEKKDNLFHLEAADGSTFSSKVLINAAGANSLKINQMLNAETFPLSYRRGEYMLLDLQTEGLVKSTVFPLPTEAGKGVLVTPTVGGNIMFGPTATDSSDSTCEITPGGISYIKAHVGEILKTPPFSKTIRVFSGVRTISGDDFVIEKSKIVDNFIFLGGICSPGLSSAPAIGKMVEGLAEDMLDFKPLKDVKLRSVPPVTRKLSEEDLNALIEKNKDYGVVVCRCEKVTKGEIIDALESPLAPKSLDALKRRLKTGMGRCQGGFCMPKMLEIIAQHLGTDMESITKSGTGSEICVGKIKNI